MMPCELGDLRWSQVRSVCGSSKLPEPGTFSSISHPSRGWGPCQDEYGAQATSPQPGKSWSFSPDQPSRVRSEGREGGNTSCDPKLISCGLEHKFQLHVEQYFPSTPCKALNSEVKEARKHVSHLIPNSEFQGMLGRFLCSWSLCRLGDCKPNCPKSPAGSEFVYPFTQRLFIDDLSCTRYYSAHEL